MKRLFKQLYAALPFKKGVFILLKRIGFTPSQRIYQHLYFKGFFKVKIGSEKSFSMLHHGAVEENEIFWKGIRGGWESTTLSLWMELAPGATQVLDIGANTGLYALTAKALHPNATVHCFEPIPGVFSLLQKNITHNHFDCRLHEIALSNYDGEGTIYLRRGEDFAYSVTVNKNTLSSPEFDEVVIQTRKLSSIIEAENIPAIDLMKIDVEGHEVEVLCGMGDYLHAFRPTMIIEVLNDEIGKQLTTLFDGMSYLYFNIDDKKGTVRQTSTITKSDFWNYLVCEEEVARSLKLI